MSNEITLPELQEFIAGFWYHYDQGALRRAGGPLSPTSPVRQPIATPARARSRSCCRRTARRATTVMEWLTEHRNENPYPLRHHATNVSAPAPTVTSPHVRFYIYRQPDHQLRPVRRVQRCRRRRNPPRSERTGVHLDERRAGRQELGAASPSYTPKPPPPGALTDGRTRNYSAAASRSSPAPAPASAPVWPGTPRGWA